MKRIMIALGMSALVSGSLFAAAGDCVYVMPALHGKRYRVEVPNFDTMTIGDVESELYKLAGIPVGSLRFAFNGEILDNSETLAEVGIVNESIIVFLAKLGNSVFKIGDMVSFSVFGATVEGQITAVGSRANTYTIVVDAEHGIVFPAVPKGKLKKM